MKRDWLYLKITAMLALIAAVSLSLTALFGDIPNTEEPLATEDTFTVVTSFHPVYTMAQNIAADVEGVEIINLVDHQAGCLHDYQMRTEDRKVLQQADVLVINGAGAESFLEAVLESMPELAVIDLSEGLELIESDGDHAHDHDHDDAACYNSHLWVSPRQYKAQCHRLAEALGALDTAHAAAYHDGYETYATQAIDPLLARLEQAAAPLADLPTVLLHDSLVYAARDLDLHVAASLGIGEDTTATSEAMAAAEDALRGAERALILGDSQYGVNTNLTALCPEAIVIEVDTAVRGDGDKNDWVDALTAFCESLEAAV